MTDASRPDQFPAVTLATSLLRKEELFAASITRRTQWPVIGDCRRHVVELAVDDNDTLNHRGQANRPDLIHIISPDLEQFLGCLDLPLGTDSPRGIDQFHDALDRRGRLHTVF